MRSFHSCYPSQCAGAWGGILCVRTQAFSGPPQNPSVFVIVEGSGSQAGRDLRRTDWGTEADPGVLTFQSPNTPAHLWEGTQEGCTEEKVECFRDDKAMAAECASPWDPAGISFGRKDHASWPEFWGPEHLTVESGVNMSV